MPIVREERNEADIIYSGSEGPGNVPGKREIYLFIGKTKKAAPW